MTVLALTGAARQASAAPITFTDRTAWENAVDGISIETFDGLDIDPLPIGLTGLNDVDVSLAGSVSAYSEVKDGRFYGFIKDDPLNDVYEITFDFRHPVIAWGGDFVEAATENLLVAIVGNNAYELEQLPGQGTGFFGTIEAVPFTTLTLRVENLTFVGESFFLDDLSFATATAVPEPATLLLLATGTGALAARRRFRQRG